MANPKKLQILGKLTSDAAQADWNQNDPDSVDYVKNRTHYTEVVEESIEGLEFTVSLSDRVNYGEVFTHNLNIPLQLGQIWKCVPLGEGIVEVTGNAKEIEVQQTDAGILYLGDLDPINSPDANYHIETNTSIGHRSYVQHGRYYAIKIIGVSGSVSTESIHQIDPKYIKDMYYEEEARYSIEGLMFEFPVGPSTHTHNFGIPFELGQEWKFVYNNVQQIQLSVKSAEDGTLYIGVPDGAYYFTKNTSNVSPSFAYTATCSITGVSGTYIAGTTIHKLDPKYLPDTIIDASKNAVQYAPQDLTDEQKTQARRNIAQYRYDWCTAKYSGLTITVADCSDMFDSTCVFDCELANNTASVTMSSYSSLAVLAFSAKNMLQPSAMGIVNQKNISKVFAEYDLLKEVGALSSSTLYLGYQNSTDDLDADIIVIITSFTSGDWTHMLQVYKNNVDNCMGALYWNKDTQEYQNSITRRHINTSLNQTGFYADSKAVGDALALKVDKTDIATDEDIMNLLSELEMVNPVTTSDGSILTSATGDIYSL